MLDVTEHLHQILQNGEMGMNVISFWRFWLLVLHFEEIFGNQLEMLLPYKIPLELSILCYTINIKEHSEINDVKQGITYITSRSSCHLWLRSSTSFFRWFRPYFVMFNLMQSSNAPIQTFFHKRTWNKWTHMNTIVASSE